MKDRLTKLRQLLKEQNLDAALISSVPNIFYLTGYGGFSIEERDAFVLITQNASYIFTHALFAESMGTAIPHMKLIEFTREKRLTAALQELIKKHSLKTIGIEENNLTVAEYKKVTTLPVTFSDMHLSNLREIKEATELKTLKKACEVSDEAFTFIATQLKPGVTEKEIERMLELFFVEHGASPSFRSVVCFGKNASVPHHLSGETKLQKRDCVLIDMGAKVDGYCADVCRTFFIGDPSEKEKHVYETVKVAMEKAIAFAKTQIKEAKTLSTKALDAVARDYIVSQGYDSYPHLLGHGVGLEVHEAPHLSPYIPTELKNGMVFTMEPGVYLPGKFGVRIEDVFTLQDNQLIQLSTVSKEILSL